jgi:hypothetical protein
MVSMAGAEVAMLLIERKTEFGLFDSLRQITLLKPPASARFSCRASKS